MQDVPLRSILVDSLDEKSPNFISSQNFLQDFMRSDPQHLTRRLILEVTQPEVPYNVVFLSLVLMDHCVNQSLIPITCTNRYVQSNFPTDLILRLFDVTFSYFLHQEDAVRNTAIHLFSVLSMTQLEHLAEHGIDRRLIEMLNNAQSYEALWSATQCIWSLMLHYKFSEEQNQIIIQNLFRILSLKNGNFKLIESCVRMLGNFIYLIERLLNDDQKFLDFINQIMKLMSHPELEEVVYQFMDETISQFPELLPHVCPDLLKNSIAALCKPATRNVLLAVCVMWESIIGKSNASLQSLIDQIVQPLILPMVLTMQSVSINYVIDYQEWEPYTAAYSCLQCFVFNSPDVSIPMFLEYAQKAASSQNPFDREGALKCIKLSIQASSLNKKQEILQPTFELLTTELKDPDSRVRNASVSCLLELLKNVKSWQPLAKIIPELFDLIKDVEPTAKLSLKALKEIAKLPDFDCFRDLFTALIEIIPTLSPQLIQSAIECFILKPKSKIDTDTTFMAFEYLYKLIIITLNETRNSTILDALCYVISSIIMKCDRRIEPLAQDLCKMMYSSFNELSVSNALTVVANLSYPLPDFVTQQLFTFVPLILNSLKSYNDPTTMVPAIKVVPLLVDRIELGDFFEVLMNSMYVALSSGETALTKTEVLKAFFSILCTQPVKFRPFILRLQYSIYYIISNLEIAYQQYSDLTANIVEIICKIESKLFVILSRQDQKHIFDLCVLMLNTIAKMPPLLRLNNGDLFDIILIMYKVFGEETNKQIQQVPAIEQIIRSGLKLLNKSDTEIENYISWLISDK